MPLPSSIQAGIRYFDLRVQRDQVTGKYIFIHMQYANEVFSDLVVIRKFLESHPKEVVLLDFNHFYGMKLFNGSTFYQDFFIRVKAIFDGMIYDWGDPFSPLKIPTLQQVWASGAQVLLSMDYQPASIDFCIHSECYKSVWPNKFTSVEVEKTMNSLYENRRDTHCGDPGYESSITVYQWVLTPNVFVDIIFQVKGNSLEELTKPVHVRLENWLKDSNIPKTSGRNGINVLMADFCIKNYPRFAYDVIQLNCAPPNPCKTG